MPTNATEQIGDIRARRQELGLSQEALARRAACSLAYVRTVEHGYRPEEPEVSPVYQRILGALTLEKDKRHSGQSAAVNETTAGQGRHETE